MEPMIVPSAPEYSDDFESPELVIDASHSRSNYADNVDYEHFPFKIDQIDASHSKSNYADYEPYPIEIDSINTHKCANESCNSSAENTH